MDSTVTSHQEGSLHYTSYNECKVESLLPPVADGGKTPSGVSEGDRPFLTCCRRQQTSVVDLQHRGELPALAGVFYSSVFWFNNNVGSEYEDKQAAPLL